VQYASYQSSIVAVIDHCVIALALKDGALARQVVLPPLLDLAAW